MNKSFINLKLQVAALHSKATTLQQIIGDQKKSWDLDIAALEKQVASMSHSVEQINLAAVEDKQQTADIKSLVKEVNVVLKQHQHLSKEPTEHLKSLQSMQAIKEGRLSKTLSTLKEKYPDLAFDNIEKQMEDIDNVIEQGQQLIKEMLTQNLAVSEKVESLKVAEQKLLVPLEMKELSKKTDWLANKFAHLSESQDAFEKLRHEKPVLFSSLSSALNHLKLETASLDIAASNDIAEDDKSAEMTARPKLS